jgi:radical SAM superfamily enzyme YgiQ (UPF0313 family)
MKTLITTLNSKFIHTSLSLRLLYVGSKDYHDVDFKEYTIKDSLIHIKEDLLSMNLDVLAFSCYIWNIEYIQQLCSMLKQERKDLIIILGGPEVTYEPEHFLNHYDIDYVMSGEGELTFKQLLDCLKENKTVDVCGVSYKGHIVNDVSYTPLDYLETLDSPYNLKQDQENMSKRILYFETSRGCPFMCQYCLSSLEKGLRFFSKDYLRKQLDIIINSDAKVIKLLDRSFNANVDHALFILEYIFNHYKEGQQFQFEINADVFQQRIIDYIKENAPKGLLRFEVGIQSTYEPTNKAVKRIQNFERLSEVVRELMDIGKCDLHLDLIAGLPYESYERFQKSFDDVFAFRAKELQLGFLKMLRGTSLRNNSEELGYRYDENPPYEMIDNQWMSQEDISNIHLAEDMLEKYWNSGRFVKTMNAIMDDEISPFQFFYSLGKFYIENNYKVIGYQLDELFMYLDSYVNEKYHDLLIWDYLSLFKVKPKKWYEPTMDKHERKEAIDCLVYNYHLNKELLYRYAVIEKIKNGYLVCIYKDYKNDIKYYEVK